MQKKTSGLEFTLINLVKSGDKTHWAGIVVFFIGV